jgi:hypothetical protein
LIFQKFFYKIKRKKKIFENPLTSPPLYSIIYSQKERSSPKMKVKIYDTHKMTLCYDSAYYDSRFESWENSLTIEKAIEEMKYAMRLHHFLYATATDPDTGELFIEILDNDED